MPLQPGLANKFNLSNNFRMQQGIRILSTKKLLPNQKQFLLNAGFSVLEANFIATKTKPFVLESCHQNLIFTSKNSVQSILESENVTDLKDKTCFCVGDKTAEMLQQNGFKIAAQTDYATELAEIIVKKYKQESFTFFSGNLSLDTLPLTFKINGIKYNEVEVYETVLSPKKINATLNGILFFSPSAIDSYLLENSITDQTCFCIGTTTANALKNKTENIVTAKKPSVQNTIIQCIDHFKS